MKKTLLICGAALLAFSGQAQSIELQPGTAQSTGERQFAPAQQNQNATVLISDTLHYFFNKNYYKNTTVGNANTTFYTIKSPYQTASLSLTHAGSIFMNAANITVHGLEGLVMRNPNSTNLAVAVKLYLYNLNGSLLPIMPAIDSVITSVSNSTAGVWVGGNFATPKTVTGNFAVGFASGSIVAGDTIRLFLNNAAAPNSTVTGHIKYGEGFGLLRWGSPTAWDSNTGNFGPGTDYEFIVAPRISFNATAGIGVLTPTICNNSIGSFSNTSVPMSPLENRQFNFNKFAAYWQPITNTVLPTTDSIWNWTFSGAAPPASNMKNPSVLFNTPGSQSAGLSVNYWFSVSVGFAGPANPDATSANIFIDASQSPTISVSGNTNICSGQSTTLTASGNPSFTWYTPSTVNQNQIVVVPSTTTQYTVTASNGNCTSIKIVTVQVSSAPNVVVTGPTKACVGAPFTFVASGAQSYQWSNTNQTATITEIATTPGVVEYTVTGSAGSCPQSVAVKQITINALPVVSLTTPSTVCSKSTGGTSVTLTGSPSGAGGTYNGTGVVGNVFTPNNPGNVPVTFVYTDPATGCSANAAKTITVIACQVNPGISEQEMSKISVFPNPAVAGIVYLQNLDGFTSLTVVNILGEQIRTESVSGNAHRLDLSTLPEGQYFIRLTGEAGVANTVKIVNQH